jgi:cell division protein DivIC
VKADDFREQSHQNVWHFLNRMVSTLIVLAIITLAICAFLPELKRQREQATRLEELRSEIEKQRTILNHRTREADLLKNDPHYVEMIARDRLDLMKPGETIVRLEQPAPDKSKFKLNQ